MACPPLRTLDRDRLFPVIVLRPVILGSVLMSTESRPNQLTREACMSFRVMREAEIGAAGVLGGVIDAAVGIDLEHEGRATTVDPQIAAAKARALERDEETGGNIAQASVENRIGDGKSRQLVVIHPLHVR